MLNQQTVQSQEKQFAEIIKKACLQAALDGYEDAAMNGLCCTGAWEAAISAIKMLDLDIVLKHTGSK